MAPVALVTLGLVTLIFALWAVAMFHMLWHLNRRAGRRLAEAGGGYFAWLGHSMNTFFAAMTSDKDRAMRRRIVMVTGLLILSIAAHSYVVTRP